MKLLTIEQMQFLEQGAEAQGVSIETLTERSGLVVASRVWDALRAGEQVLVLVGPGNNGSDGLVAARHLQQWGAQVLLYLCTTRPSEDPQLARAIETGAQIVKVEEDTEGKKLEGSLQEARLVIDAVLGTGRLRPLAEPIISIFATVRETKAQRPSLQLLALDIPSGLDANTGAIDPACVATDVTVALGWPKVGLCRFPGADYVGRLVVADIGIPAKSLPEPAPDVVTSRWVRELLPSR